MDSLLERTRSAIERAAAGMSQEQLVWHPDGKWSAAQILEHLSLAFAGTARGMERVLADKSAAAPRTMKHRVATFVVTGLRYMPSGRQAPAGVVPGTGSPSTIVQTIFANLYSMDAQLAEVEKTKGRSVRVQHPILGPLTVPQWRKFHWVHTSHHMKQIARLKEMQSRS